MAARAFAGTGASGGSAPVSSAASARATAAISPGRIDQWWSAMAPVMVGVDSTA